MSIQDFPLLPFRYRDLVAHPRNAEIYDQDRDTDDLPGSVHELGILHDPIVHRRTEGTIVILSGHRRINSALASGKSLDDTVLCRCLSGLSEWDERAILVHANKQREKTRREVLAERHELISIARELGVSKKGRSQIFSKETPRNLGEAAKKTGLTSRQVSKISAIATHIKNMPVCETKTQCQELFSDGKYKVAARILDAFWNANPNDKEGRKVSLRKKTHKSDNPTFKQLRQKCKAQELEIDMLKKEIVVLKKKLDAYEKTTSK